VRTAKQYLAIGHMEPGPQWATTVGTYDPPTTELAAPVRSFDEARERAEKYGYELEISPETVAEMKAAGVGPTY
jgi:hypothetical protein